jgi:hypothetical protein
MPGDLAAYWRKVARAQDFHVRALVHGARSRALDLGKAAVCRNRGEILDFRTFGDQCLSMIVEMDGTRVLSLVDSLVALGWTVDVDPDRDALARRAADLLEGTFQLTFERDGELARPVPAVPG